MPVETSGFSWGISTLGCAELSLPQICELLGEFGLHELEIRAVDGRMDLPKWAVDVGWSPQQAKFLFAKHQIDFVSQALR